MKSILFCTSYIKDSRAWEQRYQRWLNYYQSGPIQADKKILIDDGSPFLPPASIIKTIRHDAPLAAHAGDDLIIRFDQNLGRQSVSAYPGWWRSFLHAIEIAKELGADKIIHIESDAYILSRRLADFINTTQSGWHVLWTQRYQFPETAIQVICRDQFAAFDAFKEHHAAFGATDIAERLLPFSSVNRDFKGDRYGEMKRNRGMFRSKKFDFIPLFDRDFFRVAIPDDADFATQVVQRQQFEFGRNG